MTYREIDQLAREHAREVCGHSRRMCQAWDGSEPCKVYQTFLAFRQALVQRGAVVNVPDGETVIHAWTDGDRSVGIDGESATLILHAHDGEILDYVKEAFGDMLRPVFDFKIKIATADEMKAWGEGD